MVKNILILITIIFIFYFIYQHFFAHPQFQQTNIKIKNIEFSLEIAQTVPQLTKGLMDRTSLCPHCGMIFIFNSESIQTFWMKNTLIPLDMIFLDKNGRVINIITATPQPNTPDYRLKLYSSTSPSKSVIELNAGTAKNINLRPSDSINLPPL